MFYRSVGNVTCYRNVLPPRKVLLKVLHNLKSRKRSRRVSSSKHLICLRKDWRTRQDLEPVTSAFGGQRSIQLSYGCLQDLRQSGKNEPAGLNLGQPTCFLAEARRRLQAGKSVRGGAPRKVVPLGYRSVPYPGAGSAKGGGLGAGGQGVHTFATRQGYFRSAFSLLPGIQQPRRRVRCRRQVAPDQCFTWTVLRRAPWRVARQPSPRGLAGGLVRISSDDTKKSLEALT